MLRHFDVNYNNNENPRDYEEKKRPKFKADYQFVLHLQCHTLNAPWSVRYFVF